MRKRIHENQTRREMKQVIVLVKLEVATAFKSYCKSKGTSMNLEIEQYITEKSKSVLRKPMPTTQLSYKEAMKGVFESFPDLDRMYKGSSSQ